MLDPLESLDPLLFDEPEDAEPDPPDVEDDEPDWPLPLESDEPDEPDSPLPFDDPDPCELSELPLPSDDWLEPLPELDPEDSEDADDPLLLSLPLDVLLPLLSLLLPDDVLESLPDESDEPDVNDESDESPLDCPLLLLPLLVEEPDEPPLSLESLEADDADDSESSLEPLDILLPLDPLDPLEPLDPLGRLLLLLLLLNELGGRKKRVGLNGPVKGIPAWGSGMGGITCHSRWMSTRSCCRACSTVRNHDGVPELGNIKGMIHCSKALSSVPNCES